MTNCFVIMPFRPELAYFYRALKTHVENMFPDVKVERGDEAVLTVPLLDKIVDYIRQADVVIADCTGRNPNVFYELGIAHAFGKRVILVTSDPIQDAPADIRAFELVSYAAHGPEQFLARVDEALRRLIGSPFAGFYEEALALFDRFRADTELELLDPPSEAQFEAKLVGLRAARRTAPRSPGRPRAKFLTRLLLGMELPLEAFVALERWIDEQLPE